MTTCESCGCMGDFHALGCPALQGDERDQRIRAAERAVLAAAEAVVVADEGWERARKAGEARSIREAFGACALADERLAAAVRALREARKGTP